MDQVEQADGSNYRDDSKSATETADGSNYRDGEHEASEPADGSNYRDDDESIAERADGSNYQHSSDGVARNVRSGQALAPPWFHDGSDAPRSGERQRGARRRDDEAWSSCLAGDDL